MRVQSLSDPFVAVVHCCALFVLTLSFVFCQLATAAAQAIATFHGLSALAAGVNFAKKRSTFKQFACNPHVYLAIAFIAGCVLRANK